MANAFSSSSSSSQHKFDVFISFRGEDTRYGFTSHLYHAFRGKKINAYIDEESLKKGDEISPALMRAIQESLISVVILSENYASSSWCLDELNHILQCKEISNQIVVPVFYEVSPSQVEKQQGSYGSAFAAHEDRFKDQMDKVQQWRDSLTKVANLERWNSSDFRSDFKLVEAILIDILEKLHHMLPYDIDFKDLVGIEKRIQHVESLLNIDSLDGCIVGIWGMGGIGKTTLARVIFNRFAYQFESSYFLENVKKALERGFTDELFSKILLKENSNLQMWGQIVKERLRQTKVFIVLDDVDDVEQYEYLVRDRDRFGDGSKIIVTTRDKQVLNNIGVDKTYEVEKLDFSESEDLFCSKAFPRSTPTTDYTNLFRRVDWYSGGIPLALKVLGSHLQSKSTKEWESELDKLETIPNNKVHNVLKISYDGLHSNEKEIFLDLACFFKGENEHFVKRVLDAYGNRFVDSGIRVLMDKSLITTTGSTLQMHNLLQETGRKIVCDESKKPGKRSRLWLAQDIFSVLKHKTGTGVVQGMSLSMYLWNKDPDVKQLDPLAFKEMHNLKFIRFRNCWYDKFEFPQGLEFLPNGLIYISWDHYPLKYLPSDFNPRNLVELHLQSSKLEHLWNNGVPNLKNLKVLNLSFSKNLIQIQDLSLAVNLEEINLKDCYSLESLPDLSLCANLKEINLKDCYSLESLPDLSLCTNLKEINLLSCTSLKRLSDLSHSANLKEINLWNCSSLKSLSSSIGKLKSLKKICLNGCTHLENVPDLSLTTNLYQIDLSFCSSLESLPDLSICTSLKEINLCNCSSLKSLPNLSICMSLKEINLCNCSSLKSLPNSIGKLKSLEKICLKGCTHLENVPDLSLTTNLYQIDLTSCSSLESLPDLPICTSLKEINLYNCSSLKSLPNSIGKLKSLKIIVFEGCTHLENVPDLSLCVNLEYLCLTSCYSLENLPNLPVNTKFLKLSETAIEEVPHSIEFLSNLLELDLSKCKRLKRFPITICKLKSLRTLDLHDCSELEYLPDIWEPMELLRHIFLNGSGIKGLPSSIENLIRIRQLNLNECKNLRSIPHCIYHMRIKELNLSGCSNLENFSFLTSLPPSLRNLNLSHTYVSEIPDCIFSLPELRRLSVAGTMISKIPESIKSSKELNYLNMRCCKSVRLLPELPCGILEIDASGCTSLEMFSNTSIDALMEDPRVIWRSLYFIDCLKLDYNYIITEFQTSALCRAADERYVYDREVHACYTGDEIPKWFNHQNNDGSRVNVKLSPHDLNFMASFATSVVIARGEDYEEEILVCDICIRTNDGEEHFKLKGEFYNYENNHTSNHMHMWNFKKYNIDFSSAKEISFDFQVHRNFSHPLSECKVEKCGIRLLHVQDGTEYSIINRKFVDEELNNFFYKIFRRDINDEPPPKRIKFHNCQQGSCNFSST